MNDNAIVFFIYDKLSDANLQNINDNYHKENLKNKKSCVF